MFHIRPLIFLLALLSPFAQAEYQKIVLPLGPKGSDATLHYFIFSDSKNDLTIIDQREDHPYQNLEAVMLAKNCIAGCNGGFYHPNREPVGLVVAEGKKSGTPHQKSSITSATLYAEKGKIHLIRSHSFAKKKAPLPKNLLQTGPFLIEHSQLIKGLSDRRYARRTFIATDGKGKWIIAYTPPTTLTQLANVLSKPNTIPGFPIKAAANLDGGSSSGLWVQQAHNPLYFREIKRVINFIGITPKPSL